MPTIVIFPGNLPGPDGEKTSGKSTFPPEIDPASLLHSVNVSFPRPRIQRALVASKIAMGCLGPPEIKGGPSFLCQTVATPEAAKIEQEKLSRVDRKLKDIQITTGATTAVALGLSANLVFLSTFALAKGLFVRGFLTAGVAVMASALTVYTWALCKSAWKERYRLAFKSIGEAETNEKDLRRHPLYIIRELSECFTGIAAIGRREFIPLRKDRSGQISPMKDEVLFKKHRLAAISYAISTAALIVTFPYSWHLKFVAVGAMFLSIRAVRTYAGRRRVNERFPDTRQLKQLAIGSQSDLFSGSRDNQLN